MSGQREFAYAEILPDLLELGIHESLIVEFEDYDEAQSARIMINNWRGMGRKGVSRKLPLKISLRFHIEEDGTMVILRMYDRSE